MREFLPSSFPGYLLSAALPAPGAAFPAPARLAVADACWARTPVPRLDSCCPSATEAQLRKARRHARGGALLRAVECFPGSASLLPGLRRCVRTGDFVRALPGDLRARNEPAFAGGMQGLAAAKMLF